MAGPRGRLTSPGRRSGGSGYSPKVDRHPARSLQRRHSFGTALFDGCRRHRQKAIDLIGYVAAPIGALHQNDADQVFSRVHPRVGTIGAAFDETADRVIAESAERLTHHLETEAVTHSRSKARFH